MGVDDILKLPGWRLADAPSNRPGRDRPPVVATSAISAFAEPYVGLEIIEGRHGWLERRRARHHPL
jgi:hypothetical protein